MQVGERRDTDVSHEDQRPPAAMLFDAPEPAHEKGVRPCPRTRVRAGVADRAAATRARTLDVGSGTGRPTAAALIEAGHSMPGVDVSPSWSNSPPVRSPKAEFRCGDVLDLPLEADSLNGVCVYFSLLQMTRAEQSALTRRLALRPSGLSMR